MRRLISVASRNRVNLGDLDQVEPLNDEWGYSRGIPIDRYYIEQFLGNHSADVHGTVLSIGDDHYAQQYGGSRVVRSDILHISDPTKGTIVADLVNSDAFQKNSFDCFLLIQTLQLVYDVHAAIRTTYDLLKPGGVVLATFPGITPMKDVEWNDSWYWSFTKHSAFRLFSEYFPESHISISGYGNALAATSFLHGLSPHDIPTHKLSEYVPGYDVVLSVRAVKPSWNHLI
ncbi:MAG: hypothetical protein NPIRA05_05040 [Nitrospirales bacterium]|nr:MAG: hypothetical protein NPIRA05_05040 [Nitrospirales bacterium]